MEFNQNLSNLNIFKFSKISFGTFTHKILIIFRIKNKMHIYTQLQRFKILNCNFKTYNQIISLFISR